MKVYLSIFILLCSFLLINNDEDYYQDYEGNPYNINIESISYELTYNNYSVVKVVVKTYDQIEMDFSFIAYLRATEQKKDYKLNCSSTFYDTIECYTGPNIKFNLEDKYTFYYDKGKYKYTFDENEAVEDTKSVSLIFKPEINVDEKLYKDHKRITAITDGKMVGGGYLYITRKGKGVLNKRKDGFNKYIELNNFIPKVGFHTDIPLSTLIGYKKAIKRGYHIVDAILRFTKDRVPVISHEEDLEKISDGEGKIYEYKYKELLKLDFGTKIDEKYKGEKILSLQILLQLCKELNVIIDLDLSQLDYKKYFFNNTIYSDKIIKTIEEYEMFDSVYFSDGANFKNILELKKLKKNIAISIVSTNTKDCLEKIKDNFSDSKIIILNTGESSNAITEDMVKNGVASGNKVKAGVIDDKNKAKKIQEWGVNYITTKSLPSFLIENSKEEPIIVRCIPFDDENSECEIDDDIFLKDNEWYDIYYSENIYKIGEDINENPIGEFQYIDTNLLDEFYYKINKFYFDRGIINLNLSHILKRGEEIYGVVGPEYDDVAECYQYNFVCQGADSYTVDCKIEKDEEEKIEYTSVNYCIYYLDDYSLNEYEAEERAKPEETYYEYIVEKKKPYLIICIIIIAIIICVVVIYFLKFKNNDDGSYGRIRIADNNYMPDNYLYR